MNKSYYINGKKIKTNGYFAYDKCHKIYILSSYADMKMMAQWGYEFWDMDTLPSIWKHTCPLRFIQYAGNCKNIIPQCYEKEVVFKGFKEW